MALRVKTGRGRLGGQASLLALSLGLLSSLGCAPGEAPPSSASPSVPPAKPSPSQGTAASPSPAPSGLGASSAASTQGRKVVFAAPATNITAFSVLVPLDRGLFAQRGLNVTIQQMQPTVITPALNSGEVQFTNATGVIVPAAVQGLPVRVIAHTQRYEPFSLVARPEFKTTADLKGKRVAVPAVGGDNYEYVATALKHGGLAVKDVQAFPMSGSSQVTEALIAGNIDAGLLSPPETQDLSEMGFHAVTGPQLIELPSNGLGTSLQVLQRESELVKAVLDATLDGVAWAKSHPTDATDYFAKKFSLSPAVAKAAFQQQMDVLGFSFSDQVLQDSIQRAVTAAKSDKKVAITDVYDLTTFRELVRAKNLN